MYEMTTIGVNTRIRKDHNTFANVVETVAAMGETVKGDELWTAPADGNEVKKGDQWLHLTEPAVGWMAVKHKGMPYCTGLKEIVDVPPTPVQPMNTIVGVNKSIGNITTIKVDDLSIDKNNLIFILNDEVIFQ